MSTSSLDAHFKFYQLDFKTYAFGLKSTIEALKKWALYDGMKIQGYSFDKPYQPYMHREFVADFFNNENVLSTFERVTDCDGFKSIVNTDKTTRYFKTTAEYTEIPCLETTMNLFDKIEKDPSIIYTTTSASTGTIKTCLEYHLKVNNGGNDILISNFLQQALVKDDPNLSFVGADEFGEPYNENPYEKVSLDLTTAQKSEFLFKLFRHLVIGGSLCQYEDTIRPYLIYTKLLYKDLVSVAIKPAAPAPAEDSSISNTAAEHGQPQSVLSAQQQEEKPKVEVTSTSIVFEIKKLQRFKRPEDNDFFMFRRRRNRNGNRIEEEELENFYEEYDSNYKNVLFPKDDYNNFMYLIVDPVKRTCYTLYHSVFVK